MTRAAAAVALALLGCGRRSHDDAPAAVPRDLAALRASFAADVATIAGATDPRAAAARVIAGWQVPAAAWPALVTERFRPLYDDYAAAFAAATPATIDDLLALSPASIDVRWQYADDPALAPEQARLRIALPVGRPGAIVTAGGRPLAPVFAHDGRRWRALIGLDRLVLDRLAARAPDCLDAYRAAAREPCLAMSAPVIDAALAADDVELARACLRLRGAGCADRR